MLKLLVAFTAYDGDTTEIVDRIARAPRDNDCVVDVCDQARSAPGSCTAESI